jgi:hypothetical protein
MAAAFFALLMLSFASVQSIVMQASLPVSGDMMSICGHADPGSVLSVATTLRSAEQVSAAASPHDRRSGAPHPHPAACPYCAAAAHAPILASAAPVRRSANCVFTAFRAIASLGPRGPPARRPRARGPPSDPLTA